jgi:hypothetical protein
MKYFYIIIKFENDDSAWFKEFVKAKHITNAIKQLKRNHKKKFEVINWFEG